MSEKSSTPQIRNALHPSVFTLHSIFRNDIRGADEGFLLIRSAGKYERPVKIDSGVVLYLADRKCCRKRLQGDAGSGLWAVILVFHFQSTSKTTFSNSIDLSDLLHLISGAPALHLFRYKGAIRSDVPCIRRMISSSLSRCIRYTFTPFPASSSRTGSTVSIYRWASLL